jgi:outer membrane protein TolC
MKHLLQYGLFLLLCLATSSTVLGQEATTSLDLSEAIRYAEQHSVNIQAALLKVRDAEAQIKESRSRGLPQLNGSGAYNYYFDVPVQPLPELFQVPGGPTEISFLLPNNLTLSANLDAMVFDPVYFVALKAARAARTYAQLELNTEKRKVRQSVRDAYLPLLLVKANLQQLDKNITNLEELYRTTRETYAAGFAEQLDVDRLELSLANLRTERDNLSRQYDMLLSALKFTLNIPQEQALEITDELEAMNAELSQEALGSAINYAARPEVPLLDQAVQLNELNIQANRTGYLPSLRAVGAYQYQYQGADWQSGFWAPTGFVGLSLNIPIYDGGFKQSQIERAQISRDQTLLQRQTFLRSVKLEVQNARTAYESARQRLADRDRNLALAQRIYNTTQIKYQEGVGSSLEVNQAEQSLYTAQTNRLQARYELLEAKIALEEALGLQ